MVTVSYRESSGASSILSANQYFDNECDFCKVYTEETLHRVENILLRNRISYFVKPEDVTILSRLFGSVMNRNRMVVRINQQDVTRAAALIGRMRGVDIIASRPEEDWCPRIQLEQNRRKAAGYGAEGTLQA